MELSIVLTSLFVIFATLRLVPRLYAAWKARQALSRIPTIGPSGVFSAYVGAFRSLHHGRDMIQEGYDKVPGLSTWLVVVSGENMITDIRKAPDHQVSFMDAAAETVQMDYTMGPRMHHDQYHVAMVRTALTRGLVERFPSVQDEIATAFEEHIPATEAWTKVTALPAIREIVCRTSNRLFVGLPLCRDPDFCSLNIRFTIDVMKAAAIINLFPNFLKPIAGRLLTNVSKMSKQAMKHLAPIIEERLRQEEEYGKDWPGKPSDILSWLLDIAEGSQRTVSDLTMRVLGINFAAIHTTSMAFSQVLFDLAARPSYVPTLREEIEAVIEAEGLSKISLYKMRKLDSFIRESQRLSGNGAITMQRKVLKDFTFSDGTLVPKGYTIAVANFPIHHDEDSYRDPYSFDGYRFANMRDAEVDGFSKYQMISLGYDYIVFGHGRHACPGRFFAVNELKALLAHVLLYYDVAFENEDRRPADRWYGFRSVPDPTATVMFRRRQL